MAEIHRKTCRGRARLSPTAHWRAASALVVFVIVAFGYMAAPDLLIPRVAPYHWESARLSFEVAPHIEGDVVVPPGLNGQVATLECRRVLPPERASGGRYQASFECVLVRRRTDSANISQVFMAYPPRRFPSLVDQLHAGWSLWKSPMFLQLNELGWYVLVALFGIGTLRGEKTRIKNAARTGQWLWVLLPSALLSSWIISDILPAVGGSLECSLHETTAQTWLRILLLAPLCEELVFRGWGFRLLTRYWRDAATLVVTSAVFALIHYWQFVGPYGALEVMTAINLFAVGLALGLVRLRTGSVTWCIVAHALYNLLVGITAACA